MAYTIPAYIETPNNRFDAAANIAHFLLANGKGIFDDLIIEKMAAKDQRRVFGLFLGKGQIRIDGEHDAVEMSAATCFGTLRERSAWADFAKGFVGSNEFRPDGTDVRVVAEGKAMGLVNR